MTLAVLLGLMFISPALVYAAGQLWPRAAGYLSAAISAAVCAAVGLLWSRGGETFSALWLPTWGLRVELAMDGLAAAYALTAAGIGFTVTIFGLLYMPAHFEKAGRPERDLARFHALMLLFMAAMIGLVVARELYALVVFWDLTALVSFLLIGTDRDRRDAQRAAMMALIVTAGSAVLLLVAVVMLHAHAGTTLIEELGQAAAPGFALSAASTLIVIAAVAKSAQVPLHFWLPRAMIAPTPVSAYLHSAAMVAAGVFLLSRLHPVLAITDIAPMLMVAIGATSILTGSVLALGAEEIKRVLAYSTVAQYGYVMFLLGLGGTAAAAAAAFYVLAHAVIKSALFLTAGAAIEAFGGKDQLSDMGGLGRRMPGLAIASGLSAAGLSGLPATVGFFKDELFYKAALEHGAAAIACAVAAAAFTFAYTWRWWAAIFLGPLAAETHVSPRLLTVSIAILAAITLIGGLVPNPIAELAAAAAAVIAQAEVSIPAGYHMEWRPEYVMTLAALTLGGALLVLVRAVDPGRWRAYVHLLGRAGPERLYSGGIAALDAASTYLHDIEVRDLRDRTAAVLVPGGILLLGALASRPTEHGFRAGAIGAADLPLVSALCVAALAAGAATRPTRHLSLVVALSAVSYSMAIVFAVFGAPDVALVAVLVQTVLTLLLLAVLSLFRPAASRKAAAASTTTPKRFTVVSWLSTAAAFGMTWAILSWPASTATADRYIQLAPHAHADDVVTGILADLRGLDTMGEATVIAIALIGAATLLREGRQP